MRFRNAITTIGTSIVICLSTQLAAEGNRYDFDRYYHSEISAAQAYFEMQQSKEHHKRHEHRRKPVLIDVRRLREYAAGHPKGSYNVPYPHIVQSNDQDPLTLYWEVYEIVRGDTDRLVMTLCRTGARSVRAGNILADPESDPATAGQGLRPFTNVRNIWEGFVGQYKYAYDGGTILLDENGEPFSLDLNNDDEMNSDVADVYEETTDANPDKDGWRNFQGLPWTTKIRRRLAYLQNPGLYEELGLTPVE